MNFGLIKNLFTPAPVVPSAPVVTDADNRRMMRDRNPSIKARFDSQFTTDDNRNHWALADAMSIDASASWQVRRMLRMRSRYEYHNNGYYQNLVQNKANYTIGSGPQLEMLTKDEATNDVVEALMEEWSKEIGLTQILHNDCAASIYNGEAFQLLRSNPNMEHPVKLDVFEIECDQISSPLFGMYPSKYPDQFFDGVVLDPWGKPQTYHVLRQHPGAFGAFVILGYEFDPWPAKYVLHSYKRLRPAQQRGIPETIPVLELFAQLRRYRKAVLGASETAADNEYVIETQAPADGAPVEGVPWEAVEFQSGMATVLPTGTTAKQFKPEQPTTNFDMFCDSLLTEISAVIQVPLFFLTLDARKANMSSAYVVTQPMAQAIKTDRETRYTPKMERIFREFIQECKRIPVYELQAYLSDRGHDLVVPENFNETQTFAHTWRWPRLNSHADPLKNASAAQIEIETGISSIPIKCSENNLDWVQVQKSIAASMGMSLEEYRAGLRQKFLAESGGAKTNPTQDENPEKQEAQNTKTPNGEDDE